MRVSLILAVFCALALEAIAADKPLAKPGDIVFDLNLSDPEIRSQIEKQGGSVANEGPNGEPVLRVSNASGKAMLALSFPVPAAAVRGAKVALTGTVRGEGIQPLDASVPLRSYEGIKFKVFTDSPTLGPVHNDSIKLHGTFPWRSTGRGAIIPDDASKVLVTIGIEKAGGTAWFSGVKIKVLQEKPERPPITDSPGKTQATRLRGVMAPTAFNKKDFDDMAAWNVNVIRWHMWQLSDDARPYDEWLESKLKELPLVLDEAQKRGIKVAVNLQSPPGGRLPDGTMRMFVEKESQDKFIPIWERIARLVKGHPAILGYDLINEPVQTEPSPEGLSDWMELQVRAAKAIRAIDSKTPIIFEVDEWDNPGLFKYLKPLEIPNVIYQAHMYWPGEFTHQGVFTDQGVAKDKNSEQVVTYPGTLAGRPLDKEALRRYLAPVREFQLAYHLPTIFVGEFSAIRWAPGAAQYIDDCISIFEEYGWDWTYHAFREWQGWSVEHANLPRDRKNHPKATEPTDREKVLRKWLDKNKQPLK